MHYTPLDPRVERQLALYITLYNWFVVPLHSIRDAGGCTCPLREECGHSAKHPHGRIAPCGINAATRRPALIHHWLERRPWLNFGIATGPSSLVVLDVDPRNDGHDSLRAKVAEHGPLPWTLTCLTGGGGQHYYFRTWDRQPPDGTCAPGLDIKGRRGLVVAPPSLHSSGTRYRWVDIDAPLAVAPDWLSHWDMR